MKNKTIYGIISSLLYGFVIMMVLVIRNNKTTYLITDVGIGDIFPSLAFLPSLKKEKKIDHVTVLGVKGKEELYELYDCCYDSVIYFSQSRYKKLMLFSSMDLGYAFIKRKKLISTRLGSVSRGDTIKQIKSTSYLDAIKYGVFDLQVSSEMYIPHIQINYFDNFIKKLSLIEGKTVILNPYANSINSAPIVYFEKLADELMKKGYCVLTNISAYTQEPVKGTQSLYCNLRTAYMLADYCGMVVGLRSGFLDFISMSGCKLVSVFPEDYPYFEFHKMIKWNINNRIKDILLHNINRDVFDTIEFLTK